MRRSRSIQSSAVDELREFMNLIQASKQLGQYCIAGPAQDSKGPTRGRPWEVHQIGCLSTALAKLLIVSSQAGDQGRVIVVALGKWAEVVAKRVEEMVVADEFWSQGWYVRAFVHNLAKVPSLAGHLQPANLPSLTTDNLFNPG